MEWKALERLAASPGKLVPHLDLFCHLYENGGGKVSHGSGGIVPLPAE